MTEPQSEAVESLIAEVERQTEGRWPVNLDDGVGLVDADLDFPAMVAAVEASLRPVEAEEREATVAWLLKRGWCAPANELRDHRTKGRDDGR